MTKIFRDKAGEEFHVIDRGWKNILCIDLGGKDIAVTWVHYLKRTVEHIYGHDYEVLEVL